MLRRHLAIAAAIALAAALGAGVSSAEVFRKGNLQIALQGRFTPHALPRHRPAPVTVSLTGKIETTDGSQPPPLRRIEFALNRNGKLSSLGLPTCSSRALQSTTTETALARCRPAFVGTGHFSAHVAFPTAAPFPAEGRILAFNGRRNGKPVVLLHLYGTTPVRATFVVALAVSHDGKGEFGTVLSANLPTLAGGVGSITEIELHIGRTYTYRGQRRGYISAACAAPEGFPGAPFSFARGTFYFADNRTISPTLAGDCRVR